MKTAGQCYVLHRAFISLRLNKNALQRDIYGDGSTF